MGGWTCTGLQLELEVDCVQARRWLKDVVQGLIEGKGRRGVIVQRR